MPADHSVDYPSITSFQPGLDASSSFIFPRCDTSQHSQLTSSPHMRVSTPSKPLVFDAADIVQSSDRLERRHSSSSNSSRRGNSRKHATSANQSMHKRMSQEHMSPQRPLSRSFDASDAIMHMQALSLGSDLPYVASDLSSSIRRLALL